MKKSISIILSILIMFYAGGTVFADQLTDAQKRQNELNSSISEKNEKLNKINKSSDEVKKDLSKINSQMNTVSDNLASLNKQIADTSAKISSTEKKLKIHENKLKKEQDLYFARMRAMYMQGNMSYLKVLLDFESFSDMISRIRLVRKISDHDKKVIKSLNDEKMIVEKTKDELEGKKKQIVTLKEEADVEYKKLQCKSDEKSKLESALQKDKSKYEEMIAQEKAESEEVARIIASFNSSSSNTSNNSNKQVAANTSRGGSPGRSSGGSPSYGNSGGSCCITGSRYPITSPYGQRWGRMHSGIDIGTPMGTPIYSLRAGTVCYSGTMSGYGNVVMVNHGDITTLYAHCSSLVVSNGQSVSGGQLIAYSGNSGRSTGPHLHFEVRTSGGGTVNPAPYY